MVLPGTQTSPTTKAGRHDIAKILLIVALNTNRNANNDNTNNITRQSKTNVWLKKVTIHIIITLSVSIPCCSYFCCCGFVFCCCFRFCLSCLGTFVLWLPKLYVSFQSLDFERHLMKVILGQ